jgi:hypothetical protein
MKPDTTTPTFKLPPWDFGKLGDAKLQKLFGTNAEQVEFFLEYLHQQMDIDTLVYYFINHVPTAEIRKVADEIGVFEVNCE